MRKKILLSVVACCAVVAFVPASALAHGHHKRHHRTHHARVRDFGSMSGSQSSQGSQGSQTPSPTAGTVQSVSGSVLMIALTGGTTVSGTITSDTEIECQSADTSSSSGSSGWQGHDHGGWSTGNGDSSGSGDSGNPGDDDQGQGDDDHNAGQTCDMSSLTPGAVVQAAELEVSGAGAVWKKVDLVTSSSQTSQTSQSSSQPSGS